MSYPEWPAELAGIATALKPTRIAGWKKRMRMGSGEIHARSMISPKDGFVGEILIQDGLWQKMLRTTGIHVLTMPTNEKRLVSLMKENSLYPGHAPVTLQQVIEPDQETVRTVRFWFMDLGPVGPVESDPPSGITG
jgi:hypothetical protein